jgi:hypothetical protein
MVKLLLNLYSNDMVGAAGSMLVGQGLGLVVGFGFGVAHGELCVYDHDFCIFGLVSWFESIALASPKHCPSIAQASPKHRPCIVLAFP